MRRSRHLRFVLVMPVACALLLAGAGVAQERDAEREIMRARVEQVRDDPAFAVGNVRIAATRMLPAFYERRGFSRAWTEDATREELLQAIRDTRADGLDPEDYLLSTLERMQTQAETPDASLDVRIDYDLLLTDALLRLLYHLMFGKVDPTSYDPHWNFQREVHRGDAVEFVQGIIDSGHVRERIEQEKPQHRIYLGLRAELARYRDLRERGGWAQIPPGSKLARGATDPHVAALRARLAATGDLAAGVPLDLHAFDADVESAVKAFQARHGLDPNGSVGPRTFAALNVPIDARIEQLRVNLERSRWLLHDLDPTFVIVNVAGFQVYYLRDHELTWSARAQVGKPFRKTPIFRSAMTYLVLNPTWTVPPGILAKDTLPAVRRDPSYLKRQRMQVIDHQGRVVPASSIDWSKAGARGFPYMLRQDPGPDNALGRVKFIFPNSHAVYLHDTPKRALFEESERAFSSGCIRVENPLELAALLLEGQQGWDRAAIDRAVAEGKTRTVTLAKPVPVLLVYLTAWVDRDGKLQFRSDLYGRDPKVTAGLAKEFSVRPGRP